MIWKDSKWVSVCLMSFFWSVDTTDVGHCAVTITSRINWFLDLLCKHHSFTRPLAYFEIRIFFEPSSIQAEKLELREARGKPSRPSDQCTALQCLPVALLLVFSSENWKESFYLDQAVAKAEKPELKEARGKPSSAAAGCTKAKSSAPWLSGGGRVDGSGQRGCQRPHFGLFCWTNNSDVRRQLY